MSFTDDYPGDDQEVEDPNALLAVQEGGYQPPDVEADQDAIQQEVFTELATRVPGWQAHDGNLDTWLIEDFSVTASEIRSLAADVPGSIFTTYGTNVLGIPPVLDNSAIGVATINAVDDAGYTLDIGATFAIARSGDDLVAFQTLDTAVIPPDSTSVSDVPFSAVIPGADANGLMGDGEMLDPVIWVESINVPVATSEGTDAETPDDYLDRLTNLLRMIALRPVLPQDFAILALQVIGVGRAVAMNLYDPATDTWDNERTVTLLLTDSNGYPVPSDIKQTVVDNLEALREVNWIINVIDPTYDAIDVDFEVVAFAGQDQDRVLGNCAAAVSAFLVPAGYRLGQISPAIAGGEVILPPDEGELAHRQMIRINDLIALLDRVMGVDYVVGVTIDGEAVDHPLPDVYTLPQPGAITGIVEGAQP